MKTNIIACTVLLALAAVTISAHAHGLRHSISGDDAIVVTITHDDGSPFSDQHYQVFRGDDTVAFQTGRTDARGRVVFLPDNGGTWRVRAFSEDGHGIDVDVDAGASDRGSTPETTTRPLGRGSRLLAGLALLFGIFGLITMFFRRRR